MKNYYTELTDEIETDEEIFYNTEEQLFLLELPEETEEETEGYFKDIFLKDRVIRELNNKFKYTPDFKYELIMLDVHKDIKTFDKNLLKNPFRSHWIKWFWSFFEEPKKRDIRYDF